MIQLNTNLIFTFIVKLENRTHSVPINSLANTFLFLDSMAINEMIMS